MNNCKPGKSAAYALAAILILAVSVFSGCNKAERTLIETIPGNSGFVGIANLEKILKNAGCRFNDGRITLSEDLLVIRNYLPTDISDAIDILSAASTTVDLSHVVAFGKDAENIIVTFPITDIEMFSNVMISMRGTKEKNGDLISYRFNGFTVVTDGNQGWVANDTYQVTDALKEASGNHIGKFSEIVNFIENPGNAVSLAINTHSNLLPYNLNGVTQTVEDAWICNSLTLNDNIIGTETTIIGRNGTVVDFTPYISTIDTDFLRYVPDNSQAAIAIGQIKNLDGIINTLSGFIPAQQSIAAVLPYLKSIDGTIAGALNPSAGSTFLADISPKTWDMTLMVRMQQSDINALSSLIGMYGSPSKKGSDENEWNTVNLSGIDINYGSFDGYFIASTREISGNRNNSFTQAFSGKLAAAVIDIPYNSETMKAFNLPYGFYFTIGIENSAIKARFRFNGTNDAVLTTIASIIARNLKNSEDSEIVSIINDPYSDEIYPELLEPVDEH